MFFKAASEYTCTCEPNNNNSAVVPYQGFTSRCVIAFLSAKRTLELLQAMQRPQILHSAVYAEDN